MTKSTGGGRRIGAKRQPDSKFLLRSASMTPDTPRAPSTRAGRTPQAEILRSTRIKLESFVHQVTPTRTLSGPLAIELGHRLDALIQYAGQEARTEARRSLAEAVRALPGIGGRLHWIDRAAVLALIEASLRPRPVGHAARLHPDLGAVIRAALAARPKVTQQPRTPE